LPLNTSQSGSGLENTAGTRGDNQPPQRWHASHDGTSRYRESRPAQVEAPGLQAKTGFKYHPVTSPFHPKSDQLALA